jgi:hypothetical protein
MSLQAVDRFQSHVQKYGLEVLREALRLEDQHRLQGEQLPEITSSMITEAARNPKVIGAETKPTESRLAKAGQNASGIGAGAFGSYFLTSGWNWVGFIGLLTLSTCFVLLSDFEFRRRKP